MKISGILRDQNGKRWLRFFNGRISYGGFVADYDLLDMPIEALETFREHEARVSRQEFRRLDDLVEEISRFKLSVVWERENQPVAVCNVQLMESGVTFEHGAPTSELNGVIQP